MGNEGSCFGGIKPCRAVGSFGYIAPFSVDMKTAERLSLHQDRGSRVYGNSGKFVLWVTLAACLGCNAEIYPAKYNVVLVLIDTLRADHTSLYGYDRETTPNTEDFAGESIVFENARSQASCTYPSANSILTSRHPINFLAQPTKSMGIPDYIESIAEILDSNGYETVAISGSPIVIDKANSVNGQGGYGPGFDQFEICKCEGEGCLWEFKPHAACINQKTSEFLGQREDKEKPLFLYLHYMDTHGPYYPPGEDSIVFGSHYTGDRDPADLGVLPNKLEKMIFSGGAEVDLASNDLQHLIDLYDDELRYFDGKWRELIVELKSFDLWDDSIVIVVSDHGEEFMDHQSIKHCHTLYDSEIRTPFILRLPGGAFSGRVNHLVENLDIVPTVLDYLGIDAREYGFDGLSLRPVIEDDVAVRRYSVSSQNTLRSIADRRHKLIFDIATQESMLFDLVEDPREDRDLASAGLPKQQILKDELSRWLVRVEGDGSTTSEQKARDISRETEENLKAIGYLE
jgi:arylsulfatase A-like enzyme